MADHRSEVEETLPLDPAANGRSVTQDDLPGSPSPESAAATIREVPEEPPPIRGRAPKARFESWIIAAVFAVIYGVVGYFVLTDGRIASFDSLNRLNEAYMVWWNSPPKLAAVTLNAAPLGALAYLPLTIIKPVATSLVAMPVLTAVAAGMLMALLNSIMRRCEIPTGLRILMLVLFGLNPMFVFYAGNGEPVVLGMVAAAIGLLSLISWKVTGETRHLVAAGLAIGVAVLVDYGYALWAVGFTFAIMFISSGRKDHGERVRSTLIVFLTPIVYALMVWVLLNTVIIGSPFGWITAQSGVIQVNTTGVLQAVTATPLGSLSDLFQVVLGIAPLGFATLLLLVAVGIMKRDSLSMGMIAVLIAAILVPLLRAVVADQADLMDLSVGLPLAMLALAGAASAYQAEESWRGIVAVLMAVGLIAAVPLGWNAMQDYRFQNQAEAFTRYAETRDSQEGTKSVGGYTVGLDPELAMARYINEELPQSKDSVLVDENFSYGVMITSGRPQLFLDRADEGEENWEAVRDNPFGKVDYMLITTSRAGDQLRKAFPQAIEGGEPGMTPVFRTDRYVLVEV
ncbi:MAG: DUF2029 domain-containing protein, partial [Actinomycetota bacterium]|nr:DUF2029 domain-containing protein [Actinomycetota bacterium]